MYKVLKNLKIHLRLKKREYNTHQRPCLTTVKVKEEQRHESYFLDVDGVLNSQQLFEKCEDDQLISVDEDNIKNLKTIVDATGAKIVLSSSWRYGWAEHSDAVQDWCQILVDILAKYDLKIIDKTEYLSSGRREDEIKDWLDKCEEKIEGFVILDDGAYEWHRHGFDKHLVKTDFCTGGLREEDADKAIKILNKKRLFSFFKKY